MGIFFAMVGIMIVLAIFVFVGQSPSPESAADRVKTDPAGSFGTIMATALVLFVFFTVIGLMTEGCQGR